MKQTSVMKLFTDGEVQLGDRKFTRLIGGFGEDKPNFLLWQAAELLNLRTKAIKENFDNNASNFEEGIDFIDLKVAIDKNDSETNLGITKFLKDIGYSQNKLNATKQWLTFSLSGMMKLVKIATTKESWNIYDKFLEDYFKTKAENAEMKSALEDEVKELENERFKLLGLASYNPNENERVEAQKKAEELNTRIRKLTSSIDNKNLIEALEKQGRLKDNKKSYILLSDFGDRFNCKIGAKIMGKVLRIIGIAKKSRTGTTIPYRNNVPKYAYNNLSSELNYVWEYSECVKELDRWLKDYNEFERFYSITDSGVMELYINDLCAKYLYQENEE